MAYTKTGVRLYDGNTTTNIEENGWVPTISATGLEDNTTYTATAYVVANGETFTSSSSTFTTLPEGRVVIDGLQYEYDRDGQCYVLSWKYASTYPVEDELVRCFWSSDPNMRQYDTYLPNVSPNSVLDGTCDVKIPAEVGIYYLVIYICDMYGYKSDGTPYEIS